MRQDGSGSALNRVCRASLFTAAVRWEYMPLVAAILLLGWKLTLNYICPVPVLDGVWTLSQTFSLLRGHLLESSFAHGHIQPYLFPYGYAVLSAPFYALWHGPMSLFVFNTGLALAAYLLLKAYYRRQGASRLLRWFVAVGVAGGYYFYSQRCEAMVLPLIVILFMLISRRSSVRFKLEIIGAGLVTAVIGIIHPVHGFLAITIVTIELIAGRRIRNLLLFYLYVALFVFIIYGPVVAIDPHYWWSSLWHYETKNIGAAKSSPLYLAGYSIFYNPLPFIFMFIGLIGARRVVLRELLPVVLLVLIASYFNRHYYLSVVVVYIMLRLPLYFASARVPRFQYVLLFLFAPIWSHYSPTIKYIENPEDGRTAKKILALVESTRDLPDDKKRLISGRFSMPIIDMPNSVMLFFTYSDFFGRRIRLGAGDLVICAFRNEVERLDHIVENPLQELEVSEIIPENEGSNISADHHWGGIAQRCDWVVAGFTERCRCGWRALLMRMDLFRFAE